MRASRSGCAGHLDSHPRSRRDRVRPQGCMGRHRRPDRERKARPPPDPRSRRRGSRRLVLVLGVTAFLTLDGEDRAAPPATRGPSRRSASTTTPRSSPGARRRPRTAGVWRLDNGSVMMRFAPPDLVSLDHKGRLLENPAVQGRYTIDGDTISINVDGGADSCGGRRIAMRASVPGRESCTSSSPAGAGACDGLHDERWVMEQMLPLTGQRGFFAQGAGWPPVAGSETGSRDVARRGRRLPVRADRGNGSTTSWPGRVSRWTPASGRGGGSSSR